MKARKQDNLQKSLKKFKNSQKFGNYTIELK